MRLWDRICKTLEDSIHKDSSRLWERIHKDLQEFGIGFARILWRLWESIHKDLPRFMRLWERICKESRRLYEKIFARIPGTLGQDSQGFGRIWKDL